MLIASVPSLARQYRSLDSLAELRAEVGEAANVIGSFSVGHQPSPGGAK